jgi:hypothetical protein
MDMTTRDGSRHKEVGHGEPPRPAQGPPGDRVRWLANLLRVLQELGVSFVIGPSGWGGWNDRRRGGGMRAWQLAQAYGR